MFDNVKAFEIKLKTVCQQYNFYVFRNTQKHGILKLVNNQTFRAFKYNIQVPILGLVTEIVVHFHTDFTS